jgi:hypothetical protein
VLAGDATISVGGVDLVYLGLNAVLSSVETLERAARERSPMQRRGSPSPPDAGSAGVLPAGRPAGAAVGYQGGAVVAGPPTANSPDSPRQDAAAPLSVAVAEVERLRGVLPERVEVDPEGVEQGLAKLVLTLVEFIRQLLERQAVRRLDGGGLTEEQVERMGLALQRLEAKMGELCRVFGINPDDLNIDLGPLGDLI